MSQSTSQTTPALVAITALYDRYAATPPLSKHPELIQTHGHIDREILVKEGSDAISAEFAVDQAHHMDAVQRQIYKRRRETSPHIASLIQPNLGVRWKSYVELIHMDGYIPPIDVQGRIAALKCAEDIRLGGGLIIPSPNGTLRSAPGTAFNNLSNMNSHELDKIHSFIKSDILTQCRDEIGQTTDALIIAAHHTDEAMAAYGLNAEWIERKNAAISNPRALKMLKDHVIPKYATIQTYNTIVRALKHLDALSGGSANAVNIWLNFLNHIHESDEAFIADSPADIIRNIRDILDISDAAWRKLVRMPEKTLMRILSKQHGDDRPRVNKATHTGGYKTVGMRYQPLISSLNRRTTLGESRHKGPNDLLDNIFSTGMKARTRPWRRFRGIISEYIRMTNTTPAQRGCTLSCIGNTLKTLIIHHDKNVEHASVPIMKWPQYITNMRAEQNRSELNIKTSVRYADKEIPPRMERIIDPYTSGDITVTPVETLEQLTNLQYQFRQKASGHWTPECRLFLTSKHFNTPTGMIVMSDRLGHGRWTIETIHNDREDHDLISQIAQETRKRMRDARHKRTERRAA